MNPQWQSLEPLRVPIPERHLKDVRVGARQFTSIEAYYVIYERLCNHFGPMGFGWGLEVVEWPRVVEKCAVASGHFWYTLAGERHQLPVAGGVQVVHGNTGDAFKGALTRLISAGASYIGVGSEIYLQGSADTYLAHEAQANGAKKTEDDLPDLPQETGKPVKKCKCGAPAKRVKAKSGRAFWSCTAFTKCGFFDEEKKQTPWIGWVDEEEKIEEDTYPKSEDDFQF